MEYTEEIKETLIKINDFIQANNNENYKIRLLEREVPNLQELVKKLTIPDVSKPYYKGKWYYFGKCKPYPVQVDGYPVKPYKQFDTKEECQSYIDSAC